MVTYQLAIDIGSSNTVIYQVGSGVVIKEPTLIAVQTKGRSKEMVAVGNKAKELYGKTNGKVEIICPISNGVITNSFYAKMFLSALLEKAAKNGVIAKKNNVIFIVPCGLTSKEQNEYRNLGYHLGINNVEIVYSAVCALSSLGVSLEDQQIHMVTNVGGGNVDLAIMYGMDILKGCTVSLGGNEVDEDICKYLLRSRNLIISCEQAEQIKQSIGTLLPNDVRNCSVEGVDANTRMFRTEVIYSTDIQPILHEFYDKIVAVIENLLSSASTQAVADIHKRGIYLCGGMTKIIGVERYLREELGLPIFIDIHPEQTVIYGAGTLLNHQKSLAQLF